MGPDLQNSRPWQINDIKILPPFGLIGECSKPGWCHWTLVPIHFCLPLDLVCHLVLLFSLRGQAEERELEKILLVVVSDASKW